MKSIVIVYNEKSGAGHSRQVLASVVARTELRVHEWIEVSPSLASDLAPHIVRGRVLAVVGGDGTQCSVASLIAGTDAILAPLPGGTLNHFTKDLGVAQDINEAFARLTVARQKAVDVASVNGHFFVNNSSIGLYSRSLIEREKTESKLGKWPAALRAMFRSIVSFRRFYVTIDGMSLRSAFIFVGNNRYHFESSLLAERKSLNEEHLTLFVLRTASRFALMKIALFDRFNTTRHKDFSLTHPTTVEISRKKSPISVSLDGEIMQLQSPLRYEIRPGQLKVLV